ncbi:MAG: LytTR family DNA-binding domain-containing protein [Pseudobutyrivibrio sp.]|nr:LytTR family DNA-binding domain-containing protein [Pseudobutyrivibrio sp.]
MFLIGICDDDGAIRESIKEYVNTFFKDKDVEYNTIEFSNGTELISWDKDAKESIDLLFLDVEMPGMNGIEVKSLLEKSDNVERIVFETSHIESMQEAFGLKVVGFLMKPVKPEDINRRLNDCYSDYINDKVIEIENDKFIKESQISYIKSSGNYCDIYLMDGQCIKAVRNSLSAFKRLLGEPFIQIHRSYLVNAYNLKKTDRAKVILEDNTELPIGRNYIKTFRDSYKNIAIKMAQGRI